MIWKVWTIKLFGVVVMTVRLDAVGWPVEQEVERELQRARAAGSEPQAAAAAVCADAAMKERADAPRAAAMDVALDERTLTEWFGTRSHVRDAGRVARAAMRRGLSDEEAEEVREWAAQRRRWTGGEPGAKELSDADWLATLTQAERDAMQ